MDEQPDRTYEPNPKHKWPKGWGSLCPKSLEPQDADQLLQRAITTTATSHAMYVVLGEWCFEVRPTREEAGIWHGYPVPGVEVPPDVLAQLREAGQLSEREVSKLRKQRDLPTGEP